MQSNSISFTQHNIDYIAKLRETLKKKMHVDIIAKFIPSKLNGTIFMNYVEINDERIRCCFDKGQPKNSELLEKLVSKIYEHQLMIRITVAAGAKHMNTHEFYLRVKHFEIIKPKNEGHTQYAGIKRITIPDTIECQPNKRIPIPDTIECPPNKKQKLNSCDSSNVVRLPYVVTPKSNNNNIRNKNTGGSSNSNGGVQLPYVVTRNTNISFKMNDANSNLSNSVSKRSSVSKDLTGLDSLSALFADDENDDDKEESDNMEVTPIRTTQINKRFPPMNLSSISKLEINSSSIVGRIIYSNYHVFQSGSMRLSIVISGEDGVEIELIAWRDAADKFRSVFNKSQALVQVYGFKRDYKYKGPEDKWALTKNEFRMQLWASSTVLFLDETSPALASLRFPLHPSVDEKGVKRIGQLIAKISKAGDGVKLDATTIARVSDIGEVIVTEKPNKITKRQIILLQDMDETMELVLWNSEIEKYKYLVPSTQILLYQGKLSMYQSQIQLCLGRCGAIYTRMEGLAFAYGNFLKNHFAVNPFTIAKASARPDKYEEQRRTASCYRISEMRQIIQDEDPNIHFFNVENVEIGGLEHIDIFKTYVCPNGRDKIVVRYVNGKWFKPDGSMASAANVIIQYKLQLDIMDQGFQVTAHAFDKVSFSLLKTPATFMYNLYINQHEEYLKLLNFGGQRYNILLKYESKGTYLSIDDIKEQI